MSAFQSRGAAPALATVAVLALSLLVAACGSKADTGGGYNNGPAPVGIVTVVTEPVALTTELSGRTSAFLISEVRPQVSGVIQARLFQEGAYVKAGQPLYQIDPSTYRAALDSALAGQAQAEATLNAARLKAERYKTLTSRGVVAAQTNEDTQAAYEQAVANLAAQKAIVQQARISLTYTRVLAPISGRIGKSSVTPGALVTNGQAAPLATIQNLDKIYVDVNQSATELLALKRDLAAGQVGRPATAQVSLKLEDGSAYPRLGTLEFADVSVDPGTGSVALRAVFPNPDGALLPGLFVRATIAKGTATSGILIPQAAVTRDNKGQAQVYLVGGDNKAALRTIQLGEAFGDRWLVKAGLNPGERVIVEGLQKVKPGGPVIPQAIQRQASR